MPSDFLQRLERIGRNLIRWQAELRLTWGLAVITAWIALFGLIDLFARLDRTPRLATWTVLLTLIGLTLWLVRRQLRQQFTPEGVAASVERTFPQLDNHLINFLQLAKNPEKDPFKEAYLRGGVPEWQTLDFEKMRDRPAHKRSRRMLAIAVALAVLPVLFFGQAWAVAVWRTVNPFTQVEPPSATKIVEVQPGNTTVLQGEPLDLVASVRGAKGHEVKLEVDPADGHKVTYTLGTVETAGLRQEFTYRMPKVAGAFRYRIHAGDAPNSAWYTIATRPPPAFTALSAVVLPPAYTKRAPHTVNLRDGRLVVPIGTQLQITATANAVMENVSLREPNASFTAASSPAIWNGTVALAEGVALKLRGTDKFGTSVDEQIPYALEPDKAPTIEILAPGGRATLPLGQRPQIEFRVSDDYGLVEVAVEEVPAEATKETKGTPVKTWQNKDGILAFHQIWTSEMAAERGKDVSYRIVARDNRPGTPNETVSTVVVFNAPMVGDVAKQRNDLEASAVANLQKLLDLQKKNVADTERFVAAVSTTTEGQWKGAGERQKDIRNVMKDLLMNPLKPLGGLTGAAQKLYTNEMVLAVDSLQAVPTAEGARREALGREALALETKIMRQLSFAMAAASEAKQDRRVTGLTAMLEGMVRDQTNAATQTKAVIDAKAKAGKTLVQMQDRLGDEMGNFLTACKDDGAQAEQNDVAFAQTLTKITAKAGELKVKNEMIAAAEKLDQNKAAEALPPEERALSGLKVLQAMLEQVNMQEEGEKRAAMLTAVEQAKEKITKIEELHQKMKEAMDTVKGQKDKDNKSADELEEAYQELMKNTKEAMLEVPTDLHVFSELNVANDLVEDVFSVFQEVEQAKGTDKDKADKVTESGYAKEDELLAQMGEAKKRIDSMEMWLQNKPDETKVTTETIDKAEMPKSGVALAELAAQAQDLIGDLMKEDKEMAKKADDSATTHAMPDPGTGHDVMEGDIASFAAQGKSGNQAPDHKEQDGRSNVGRQGMSNGETAASSGTIGEGDKNIEARRTEDPSQSGQVDLAGKADTKATGGGKLGTGKADGMGMSGGAERKDSKEQGSKEGMAALMARQADAMYAKASMKNIRVDSLKDAAHHLRQSGDAIAQGNIEQSREFKKMAATSLVRAKAQLEAGPSAQMDAKSGTGALDNVIESGPDMAPPQYRDKVAEYYKALNGSF